MLCGLGCISGKTLDSISTQVKSCASGCASSDANWEQFKTDYSKKYPSDAEEAKRKSVFEQTLQTIVQRNSAPYSHATHGVNEFADLTPAEFKAQYLGYVKSNHSRASSPVKQVETASVDWRGTGVLTPVKNQGQCGSCWAFSATEQIESSYMQQHGTLYTLSPQQITSCDTQVDGCNGGDTLSAYQYVNTAGGLDTEAAYPYTSGTTEQTGTCSPVSSKFAVTVTGDSIVSQRANEESKMLSQIQSSPISICVDASPWQTYTSGIMTAAECPTTIDHCVQAVGYNSAQNYWIVRNSWGTSWGNAGYIWVEAGANACGIASEATLVTTAAVSAQFHV